MVCVIEVKNRREGRKITYYNRLRGDSAARLAWA
jgi:hypothetical protein